MCQSVHTPYVTVRRVAPRVEQFHARAAFAAAALLPPPPQHQLDAVALEQPVLALGRRPARPAVAPLARAAAASQAVTTVATQAALQAITAAATQAARHVLALLQLQTPNV